MKKKYHFRCRSRKFVTMEDAVAHANAYWRKTGIFVAVEAI